VWLAVVHIDVDEVFTIGAILQIGRLFGSEIGSAFIQTFVRMREQIYSNYIGQHVISGNGSANLRLQDYFNAVFGRSVGAGQATGRSLALLSAAIRKQAYVLAYIDGFLFLAYAVVVALILMLLLRDPPERSIIKSRLSAAMSKPKGPG
jgi:DHA2 family multidrug resistance protein